LLRVRGLEKSFKSERGRLQAVCGVSFTVETGEFYTLLGPSGCGKTTTLQCIAGLETPDAGEIVMGDTLFFSSSADVDVPAHRRNIGMVFQSYAIWPHMTVYDNVAFPLVYGHHGRIAPGDVRKRVMRALERVRLEELADRPAPFLSGGQQQRVALARALVHEPPLLLFDEPLSNLDAKLREEMRIDMRRLTEALGMTTIYVTHDQVEALAMSDRIAVMRDGRIVQEGPPREVYFHPRDAFVADFLGGSNIFGGRIVVEAGRHLVETEIGRFICDAPAPYPSGAQVSLIVRPEGFRLCDGAEPGSNRIEGTVEVVSFIGGSVETRIRVGMRTLRARLDPFCDVRPKMAVRLEILSDRCMIVPASGARGGEAACNSADDGAI
jgi:iron(III) transport system ATP-binding protein